MRFDPGTAVAASLAALLVAGIARAQVPHQAPPIAAAPVRAEAPAPGVFSDQLVLDTGRRPYSPPHEGSAEVHGEYQLRYFQQTDLSLGAPPGASDATSLGQKSAVFHWLRISPRFHITRKLTLVAQLDYPRGYMLGNDTRFVGAATESMGEKAPFQVDPRWLYLDAATSVGHFRVGQQGWHWGMGLFSNDGNHPSVFGDYRRGSIYERVMFAFNPAGRRSLLTAAVAADMVFRDNFADITNRDRALQAVAMLVYGTDRNQLGLHGLVREQRRGDSGTMPDQPYTDRLSMRAANLTGRFVAPVPGAPGYVFGAAEAVVVAGTTRYAQNPALGAPSQPSSIRAGGAALSLGTVHETTTGPRRWGDLVLMVEWGYATGDNNPNDGRQTRFAFDPNHKVGLVLFDHAMNWMTARSAVSGDWALRNSSVPGLQNLPTNGAVAGASYLYPAVIVRPRHWLDLKAAMVIAQATSDVVDPYRSAASGRRTNYQGGDPARRDLGIEYDLGVEARVPMDYGLVLQLGAQGGVLFPGRAFDDGTGNGLKTQFLAVGRAGLQY